MGAPSSGAVRVAIVGLVRLARRVIAARIMQLIDFACRPGVSADIYVVDGSPPSDDTRDILHSLNRSKCRDGTAAFSTFKVIDDGDAARWSPQCGREFARLERGDGAVSTAQPLLASDTVGDKAAKEASKQLGNRVERLRALRSCSVELMRHSAAERDVIVLVDYELEKLPDARSLERAVRTVLPSDHPAVLHGASQRRPLGQYDALCAFGLTAYKLRMWKPVVYYDTFATVLENGSFARARNAASVAENGARATALTVAIKDNPTGDLYPVRSCFGGLAVYRTSSYLATRACNYSLVPQSSKYSIGSTVNQCEHVTFHLCLRKAVKGFRIAIDRELKTLWLPPEQQPPPGHPKNKIW